MLHIVILRVVEIDPVISGFAFVVTHGFIVELLLEVSKVEAFSGGSSVGGGDRRPRDLMEDSVREGFIVDAGVGLRAVEELECLCRVLVSGE